MSQLRSSLEFTAPMCRELDAANAKKAARDAWQRDGIILLNPSWFQHWTDQQQAINLAEKLYGKRG